MAQQEELGISKLYPRGMHRMPPADLSAFEQPTTVAVIPFEHAIEAVAAA
jgi:hypothetical protein